MGDDEITPREINTSLQALKETVNEKFTALNRRLDSQRYVSIELYNSEAATRDKRLDALEERIKNAGRLGIGAVIAVIVPVVLGLLKVYGGT